MIVIFYFQFTFFISFFTYLTFSRIFKIFMIFLSHNKRLIKFCFNYFSVIISFLYLIIKTFANSIFIKVSFCMVYYIVHQHILTSTHNCKQNGFDIFSVSTIIDISSSTSNHIQNSHRLSMVLFFIF